MNEPVSAVVFLLIFTAACVVTWLVIRGVSKAGAWLFGPQRDLHPGEREGADR